MQTHARKSSENRERIILFVTSGGGGFEALVDSVDVVIEKPRTEQRMTHWSTAGEIDDSAMQYFKVNVFFPFIGHCLMQIDQRFPADKTDMFLASKLMPLIIATMTPAEITSLWLVQCRPTQKCNFSTGNPPLEYVLSRS